MQGQVGAARPSFKEVWHVVRMIFQQEEGRPDIGFKTANPYTYTCSHTQQKERPVPHPKRKIFYNRINPNTLVTTQFKSAAILI